MADHVAGIEADARSWAESAWDPDLTVGEWWSRLLADRWSLPSLPDHAYGRGYSRAEEQAVWRGFAAVGTLGPPSGIATMMAAPTIADHGTSAQIDRYVPAILNGTEAWCQLFSEPGAGSDLAGLSTRAERDGESWVVTGQKVWTSFGHEADLGMLLARTDPDLPKHAGISWFAFPMRQPGVEVRPLVELTGRAMFNEVFIDAAPVADEALIGGPGGGWKVGNTTLAYERGSLAGAAVTLPYARTGSVAGQLDQRAGDFGQRDEVVRRSAIPDGVAESVWWGQQADELDRLDPVLRDELAAAHAEREVNRLLGQRARTGAVPAVGNLGKLAMSEIARTRREVANRAVGAAGMLADADAEAGPAEGEAQRATLASPAPSIYGGTDQVQRNIIGERVLGLPKEPGPPKDTPFRDLPNN
ncbi:MAG: acyl-CoA dehydrogenase family protein [Acidimicrobiia bacterium]|nr:acyl-CoA dehydrogenase family protein [Acidimicrobiia bacterium]